MRRSGPNVAGIAAFLFLTCVVAPPARGANETVLAKPGLWERTVVLRVFETRTQVPELPTKPAEDRQKIDAEMRKPVYAPDLNSTTQECLPAAASVSWNMLTKIDRDYAACTRKTLGRNSNTFKASLSCNGGKSSGTIEFKATADQVDGQITMVTHEPGYDRTETKLITSKRVAATCESPRRK